MTSSASFWDKAAPKYAKSAISDMDAYRATLARTISHLKPSDRVLEIGCGTASTALEIAPHVTHLTATDISPAMIEIAREKAWEASVRNITLATAEVGDAALAQGAPFDAVLALNLLHLVPDQEAALRQIHGVLKPGGLFISKTACLGERWFFKPMVSAMRAIGKAPFVTHQREGELRRAILSAGFEVVEELSQPGMAPRLYMVARKV
jgi:ubiquinone/menaquinone biosynthesis C-methylase UbiE